MDVPEIRYARNGDIALAWQVLGEGPRDLLLLPGFINNLEIAWENERYARFLRGLASFSRLIIMDRRGTGLSDRLSPEDLPPLEVHLDDILTVLDAAGSHRSAVFGWSDSGSLCALFAATHPERTTALVLYAAAAVGLATPDFQWQWTEREWDPYWVELSVGWGTRAYAEKMLPWFNPSLRGDERAINWWARFMRQGASPNSAVAIERVWHQIDARPVLPAISSPTLVMHCADDQIEYIEAGRDLARRIPGARFVEFPGGDNMPWAGDQRAVLDEVEEFLTGARHAPQVDRVLATVLFTDIVDSTATAAALGDARWREVLATHHGRLRAEIDRFRGREIDTAGDGFFVTFDGPARAVNCAQAIIGSVEDLGLRIRAGVHTGEVELMGDDIGGIGVHIGARLSALAGPSEVIVSSTVKDLVAGSGLTFEDAGEHELKGVPERWRLYRVTS